MVPLPDADPDKRMYKLLKNIDLENLTFAQFQSTAQTVFAEPESEDTLRRIVLINLSRMAIAGDWNGLTTAAAGGSFNVVLPNTAIEAASASDMAVLSGYPPWGNGNNSATTLYANVNGDKIYLYPFLAPSTITISNLEIRISTASSNPCDALVGIYTDSEGSPGTLIGKSSVSVATTGSKVMTAFLDSSDDATDIALTKGTQYWFGFGRDTASEGFSFYGIGSYAKPMVSMVASADFTANSHTVLRTITATLAIPASFTATDLEPFGAVNAMTAIIN
jgi:hypothetical protein